MKQQHLLSMQSENACNEVLPRAACGASLMKQPKYCDTILRRSNSSLWLQAQHRAALLRHP